ncbi:MAG TPA: tyrosine-type recombinase/integrase [Chloroflexota bacterium]|nr:tyrosine-type recombinase/integrase [Chloroflexota bacterium]
MIADDPPPATPRDPAPAADAESPALADALAAFAASLRGKSPHTAHTYATALDRFTEYLAERGVTEGTPTAALPADALESYYAWLVRRYGRTARATHSTYLAGARAFLRFLERRRWGSRAATYEQLREGLRAVVGRASYRTPRVDQGLPLVVTYALELPLPAPTGHNDARRLELLRDRALLLTLYGTGLRRAEVAALNRADVDDGWADRALVVGKGSKERVVFFDPDSLAAIRTYLAARADRYVPLFLRHDKGRGKARAGGENYRLSTQSIYNVVRHYADAAGVRASPHAFRHQKASVLLNAGAQLAEVQDLLGHASPDTTKRIYAHYETSHLKDAFDRYSVPAADLARAVRRRRGED